jgi:rRNA maturation endonuclease Nob1
MLQLYTMQHVNNEINKNFKNFMQNKIRSKFNVQYAKKYCLSNFQQNALTKYSQPFFLF